jgi:uncharacterized membrane protein
MSATRRAGLLRHPALVEHELSRAKSAQNRVADKITAFAGSMAFVYLHLLWFAAWIIFRVEAYPYGSAHDDRVVGGDIPLDVRDD